MFNFGPVPAVSTSPAPPTASGLSPWAAQVLGGLGNVNWTDLFARLMGMGSGPNLASLMVPGGGIPQLGPVTPPVAPARVGPAVAQRPATPPVAGPTGKGTVLTPDQMLAPMAGYGVGGAAGGMDVTGSNAFGDLGQFGVGYGDTY